MIDDEEEIRPALGVVDLERWARLRAARTRASREGIPPLTLPDGELAQLQLTTQMLAATWWQAFDAVAEAFWLTREERIDVLQLDEVQYGMCELSESLDALSRAGRRVSMLVEIYNALAPGRTPESLARWLRTPAPGLGEFLPLDRLKTAQIHTVLEAARASPGS